MQLPFQYLDHHLLQVHWATHQVAQGMIGHILHDKVADVISDAKVINGQDVRVTQLSYGTCLADKTLLKVGSESVLRWQHLDRHIPVQACLIGLVDRSHAARADRLDDAILTEGPTNEIHKPTISY